MQISVTVTGLDKVNERLEALGSSLHDFTSAFTTLGKALIIFYGDTVFGSKGLALGNQWTPLSPAYDEWKRKNYPGRDILQQKGTMQKSFYAESMPSSLFIGNSDPKFIYHQLGTGSQGASQSQVAFGRAMLGIGGGTRVGRGNNLPARPMIGVNAKVEGMINTIIKADVKAKIESTMV